MAIRQEGFKGADPPAPAAYADVGEVTGEDTEVVLRGTKRGIKSRQAQMLVIGGTIGTGLFVGTGQALAISGPAFLFVAYVVICFLVHGIVTAMAEVGSYMPAQGMSVAYYGNRIVSPSLGFALGWMYWYIWGLSVAYEITAAAVVINYWPNTVPVAVWITIMLVVIVALNFFPVKIYGESEFWFASIKVFAIIGLLILSVVLFFGGGPDHTRLGFWYWQNPGATKEYLVDGAGGRFCAFLFTLIYSCFSFNFSPELIIIAAGEMKSPRKNIPKAALHFVWRLAIFYVLGALAIGVICRSDEPALTNGGNGAASSPWVIAIENAGIHGLDSVINAVVITSAWSSGNSVLYMSSRALYSLAVAGNAPQVFIRCNKHGVPVYAVIASKDEPWIEVIEDDEDIIAGFDCAANAFGKQTRDAIWIATNPEWDQDGPDGRAQATVRMIQQWYRITYNSDGDANTIFLKATLPNKNHKYRRVVAGMAVWTQFSMVPGRGVRPPDDPSETLGLEKLYPNDETEQRYLRQLFRSFFKRRGEVIREKEASQPPSLMHLELCVVDPAYQRRGIASKLVQWGLDEARRRGGLEATTEASSMGRHVYRRLGFQPEGSDLEYEVDDEFKSRERPPNLFMRTGASQ
ncbi:hypothetical protein ABKA04_006838 [Annulohypoxylon sp. FPYF3050]